MKKILLLALCWACLASLAHAGSIGGMPFVLYSSTYGMEYGVIGRARDQLGRKESLTLSSDWLENGGHVNHFLVSFPDQDLRHGKAFGLALDLKGSFGNYLNERYYGLGSDSPSAGYTLFDDRYGYVNIILSRAVRKNLTLSTGLLIAGYSFSNIRQGTDPLTPQIQDNCRQYYAGAFGLAVDDRDNSADPRQGNYVLADFALGIAGAGSPARYAKFSVDLRRYAAPFHPDQVLAGRVKLVQLSGDVIPLYEYATLGGRDTLRGYSLDRFRDRGAMLLNLEYRFPLIWGLSGVVFYDAGKVAPRLPDIGLNDWVSDYGAGLRINFGNVIVRGDVGRSEEGTNFYFFYDQAF